MFPAGFARFSAPEGLPVRGECCHDGQVSSQRVLWSASVLPVWLLVAAGVSFALWQPEPIQALAVTLIGGVLATFLAQLATRTPAGFVERARLSVVGVVVLVALGGGVSLILG